MAPNHITDVISGSNYEHCIGAPLDILADMDEEYTQKSEEGKQKLREVNHFTSFC